MTAALIELETEDLSGAARELIHGAVDPIGVSSRQLWSRLADSAGMAGSDAGGREWATRYDEAAGSAVNAAVTAGGAVGQLARMFVQTARNYEAADAHSAPASRRRLESALSGVPVVPHLWLPGCRPASAGGGAPDGGPPGWSLICDAVGYVWPNGNPGRLRAAGDGWRAAASTLRSAADAVVTAPHAACAHALPEAEDMVILCTDVSDRLREIADVHDQLADACRQLADRIDQVHHEVLGELRSLLEWTAGIEAAGAVLSLFSFGLAEAPAQAVEGARIARTATLVGAAIERFTQSARTLAAAIGAASERAGALGARLGRLLDLPLLEPALAGVGPARMLRDAPEITAALRLERSAEAPTLAASERAGGHTIARHVGLTDEELVARGLPVASTFPDLTTAETTTAHNIAVNQAEVEAWLHGSRRALEIRASVDGSLGRVYVRATHSFVAPRQVLTMLKRDGNSYYTWTSYLLP